MITREDVSDIASGLSELPPIFILLIRPLNKFLSICVTEPAKAPGQEESDGSLASSSVVMPHSAPSNPTAPLPSHDESTTAPLPSNASSMSLIDLLSDDEDEDSEVYEDSRSHFGSTPGNGQVLSPDVEYVVLSDGSDEL